jgi:hypothetical protein
VSAKWDYDKTEHLSCGQYYYEYYFERGDEPKKWTLAEVAKHLSTMEGVLDARSVEIERLRFLIHNAGMSFRDHWAIDWEPIMTITDEVTAMCEKNYFALADKGEE